MNLEKSLLSTIDKLVGTLKEENELIEVLKRKFTKKEYKVYFARESGKTVEDIKELIHDDEVRIEELYKSACKKLNQEKIKQELVNL
ncbi:MAG: hypothetical protein GY936_11095 [Ignavibacteriae bacterium]|nr:hypothetical protein [Ignavibacteriota bacterium]